MGFSCPVCEDPQADAGHLANHLAITAITRGGSHEEWLDEHVPDWEHLGEAALAEEVRDLAGDAEYPQVFEDTTGSHRHEGHAGHDHRSAAVPSDGTDVEFDEETERVIREAMELTQQHQTDANDDGAAPDGDANHSSETE